MLLDCKQQATSNKPPTGGHRLGVVDVRRFSRSWEFNLNTPPKGMEKWKKSGVQDRTNPKKDPFTKD